MTIGSGRRRAFRTARAARVVACAALIGSVVATGLAGCAPADDRPRPVGDPDPGHRLLRALQPVLSLVPAGAHVTQRQSVAPMWDSCDGDRSTFGWDPPTVDARFTGGGSAQQVEARIGAGMQALGWTADGSPAPGQWQWHRTMPGGSQAQAQLFGDNGPTGWSLQASAPAATHPVRGC